MNYKDELIKENENSLLGKRVSYENSYNPEILYPISREVSRKNIGNFDFKMKGYDIWISYEFSALDISGKPYNKILVIFYDSDSENLVESKSLKLYLNSFNQMKIKEEDVLSIINKDLRDILKTDNVYVVFKDIWTSASKWKDYVLVDNLEVGQYEYLYNPNLIEVRSNKDQSYKICLSSHLLRSNCRHTGQPDWGSVFVEYFPDKLILDEKSFLSYIVSFRTQKEFHEEICERILFDLKQKIEPKTLEVRCQYTRRGGIDINPSRIYIKEEYINRIKLNDPTYLVESFKRTIRQ